MKLKRRKGSRKSRKEEQENKRKRRRKEENEEREMKIRLSERLLLLPSLLYRRSFDDKPRPAYKGKKRRKEERRRDDMRGTSQVYKKVRSILWVDGAIAIAK